MNLKKHRRRLAAKRVIDTGLVLLASPFALAIGGATALAVRIKMGSPILFKQERIGLAEKPFTMLMFRSMLPEENEQGKRLKPEDRLTRFGRALRKSSLDELPQLINVLRGEMSLVGPRPLLPQYLGHYRPYERFRHAVRPGITGPSQVSGRNRKTWDDRLAEDANYGRNGSISDDLRILGHTIGTVVRSSDVAVPGEAAEFLHEHRSYPESGVYALRRFEVGDIPARVEWFNHPRTLKFMRFPNAITLDSTHEWLRVARRDPLRKDLTVVDSRDGTPVAFVGYRAYGEDELPVIYVSVDPDRLGEGLGKLSIGLLLDYMRNTLRLPGAAGELFKDNVPTYRINKHFDMEEVPAELPPGRIRMEVRWTSG